jgi:hypothetical protein
MHELPGPFDEFPFFFLKRTFRFQHRSALQGWATRFITTHEVHEATVTTCAILLLFFSLLAWDWTGDTRFCWCCAIAIALALLASGIGTYYRLRLLLFSAFFLPFSDLW